MAAHDADDDDVPARHFGGVLSIDIWQALAERSQAADTRFVVEPHIHFKGPEKMSGIISGVIRAAFAIRLCLTWHQRCVFNISKGTT